MAHTTSIHPIPAYADFSWPASDSPEWVNPRIIYEIDNNENDQMKSITRYQRWTDLVPYSGAMEDEEDLADQTLDNCLIHS
jgi:hypothetical protein